MFIECFKNNGTDYLRVMEGYSVKVCGATKCRRRVVRNIGPLSRFDDGQPEFLDRLRQSFKEGNPIIRELADLLVSDRPADYITIRYDRHSDTDCMSTPKNMGYFLLDGLYDALGINDVLAKHKSMTKLEYDLNGLAKLLIFGRILWPDSKCETFEGKNNYLFNVTSSENLYEIYRALDCLNNTSEAIQQRINYKISGSIGRNMEVCFYDVTNFYFEIHENDADTAALCADGRPVKEGMRKKGPSKEKRGEPIVQMGLFIDDNGIPIAYQLFPGNHIDQTTLRPALKKSIDKMKFGRVIVVADGGVNSDKNIGHMLEEGNGYIPRQTHE
jgi:hypothetical protein